MAGADTVTVATSSASMNKARDMISQASVVVGNMRTEFQKLVDGLDQKIDYQGQTSDAERQVLRNDMQAIRGAMEACIQSYDQNAPAKIVGLYE